LHGNVSSQNNRYWNLIHEVPLHEEISTNLKGIENVRLYRDIIFSISSTKGNLILLFYGVMLDSYRENLIALGGESCRSCRKPGTDSYVPVYK
jgi:hypothetical protein